MAEKRIDDLDDAATVTGSHEVAVAQSGVAKRATVAELAAGISLDNLGDVVITSVADGHVVTWDSGTSKWVNEAPSGGAGAIRVEDEGSTVVAAATGINFAGAGVTVTDAGSNEALVTISGGGGGSTTITQTSLAANVTRASTTIGALSTAFTVAPSVSSGEHVRVSASLGIRCSSSADMTVVIKRNGTEIRRRKKTNTNWFDALNFDFVDTSPGTGTVTYEVQVASTAGTVTVYGDGTNGNSDLLAEVFTP